MEIQDMNQAEFMRRYSADRAADILNDIAIRWYLSNGGSMPYSFAERPDKSNFEDTVDAFKIDLDQRRVTTAILHPIFKNGRRAYSVQVVKKFNLEKPDQRQRALILFQPWINPSY